MEFRSIKKLSAQITKDMERLDSLLIKALHASAELVREEAKAKIGTYQAASGPFVEWEQLAESTQSQRVRLGYTPNDPLLRSGALRRAIVSESDGHEALVGVKSEMSADGKIDIGDIAVYMELGTAKIPPRPFLGPALHESDKKIIEVFEQALAREGHD